MTNSLQNLTIEELNKAWRTIEELNKSLQLPKLQIVLDDIYEAVAIREGWGA